MKLKVFLTEKIHQDAVDFLSRHSEVVQGSAIDAETIVREAQGCQAILVRSAYITEDILGRIPGLRAVAKHGIGVDNIDVTAATSRGIMVLNAPLANINAVAEHALALILALAKNLVVLDQATRANGFGRRNQFVNIELAGKKVGLVGFGKIARLLAKKLTSLGVEILASDPFTIPEDAEQMGVKLLPLDELLATADIISLHTPLLDSTKKMINQKTLALMKPTAVLVNVARGAIVDESALYQALANKKLAGAALDVFDPEPPEAACPLFKMENVIVSPHNAALTDQALLAMAMDSAAGIIDYLEGRTPKFPVNQELLKK